MKKLIATLAIALFATTAYAACRTYTIYKDGKVMICTECCYYNNCTITCY